MKFKVLDGKHQEKDASGILRVYRRGNVLESSRDLAKMFNRRGCIKFKKVEESTPVSIPPVAGEVHLPEAEQPTETQILEAEIEAESLQDSPAPEIPEVNDVFSEMDAKQLREYAASAGVDTTGLRTKKQIADKLREQFI